MDSRTNDNYAELPSVETPEDVAVLYSWANLHGAKYRDFSASRREYRAQLRHRAAEQARETELHAQTEAEDAAEQATDLARQAEAEARLRSSETDDADRREALRQADLATQRVAAERLEATRRAEAAAQAQAAARREEREIAEAHASARRQAALYAEANARHAEEETGAATEVPGKTSDPYTPEPRQSVPAEGIPPRPLKPMPVRPREAQSGPVPRTTPAAPLSGGTPQGAEPWRPAAGEPPARPTPSPAAPMRRPQGYRPDEASGVRQIYRPELSSPTHKQGSDLGVSAQPRQQAPQQAPVPPYATRETTLPQIATAFSGSQPSHYSAPHLSAPHVSAPHVSAPQVSAPQDRQLADQPTPGRSWTAAPSLAPQLAPPAHPRAESNPPAHFPERRRPADEELREGDVAGETADPAPRRRRQDQPGYRMTDSDRAIAAYRREQGQIHGVSGPSPLVQSVAPASGTRREPGPLSEPALPAWIHEPQPSDPVEDGLSSFYAPPAEVTSDTLQRSRERVAARWYALKGVFDPGQERAEPPQPTRQREIRTPVLAVFSFAGGVGKTSLVATLGRSLSSLGEKVLLTDTTSHGLLPFYFGASELRESTVRTFSPPSGSTDAPIYLVNYAVDQSMGDEAAQQAVVESITENGRGSHRILLDLTASTAWLIRRIAHLSPTILVPVAPDMNSVISLQSVERFLQGIDGPDGTPIKVFYVLNQFDASLPLHLDVREVLRRQLGERLLPTVIRRAPAVSEALAEGMTIIDYAADAPVAEDYMNVAHWLRTVAAPATAGFRNVRWSER